MEIKSPSIFYIFYKKWKTVCYCEEHLKRMLKRFINRFCIANDDFEATKVAHEIRLSEAKA